MKNALITGASRGLGLALARELAQRGWGLVIDARDPKMLKQVKTELVRQTQVIAVAGSVNDESHRRDLLKAVKKLGGLDALVNNASFLGPSPQPQLLDYPLDALIQVYRTNVIAPLAVTQTLYPTLKANACVVNITSGVGIEAHSGWGGYGSSKAALEHLSHILAVENPLLRVYWVDPGITLNQMQQESVPEADSSDQPLPEESVSGLVTLIEGNQPSGRYRTREASMSRQD